MRLTALAFAIAISIGIANAEMPRASEVIVVTAPQPAGVESKEPVTVEPAAPKIDFTSLTIEAPELGPSAAATEPAIELALKEDGKSKS